jgi:hypothetical protein
MNDDIKKKILTVAGGVTILIVVILICIAIFSPSTFGIGETTSAPTTSTPTTTPTPTPVVLPPCVNNWYYNTKSSNSIAETTTEGSPDKPWCMLPAYFSGGTEGLHWKYTNDKNDPECLTNWTYYDKEGKVILANIDRLTEEGSIGRPWCGLPVYKSGGVENKAWKFKS